MKVNKTQSVQVTFTLKKNTCPPIRLNNKHLNQPDEVKYLCIHLDRKLTWRKHIFTKRKQLDLKISKLYWINGQKSQLSLKNKVLVYKAILKPIWTYGVQLWRSASNSNIEILERFQSKVLRIITDAPRYVPNAVIKRDLKCYRSDTKCVTTVSPSVKVLKITPTNWQNLYFEEHITTVGLSGITLQIYQLDFN
jgi:hypothetical protein